MKKSIFIFSILSFINIGSVHATQASIPPEIQHISKQIDFKNKEKEDANKAKDSNKNVVIDRAELNYINNFKDSGQPNIDLASCIDNNGNIPFMCKFDRLSVNGYLDIFGITSLADTGHIKSAWIEPYPSGTKVRMFVLTKNGYVYATDFSYIYANTMSETLSKNNIKYVILNDWVVKMRYIFSTLASIALQIFPILFIILLWKQLRMFVKSGGNKILSHKTIRLKDIAGNEQIKEEIIEYIGDIKQSFKKNKEIHHEGVPIDLARGVLFEGPPGNGKTMFASAIAGETGLPFYELSGSSVVEMYVGLGAKKIRNTFKKARKEKKGAIIFIDEIDAFGGKRNQGGRGNSEQEQALNELLVQLDGVQFKKKNDKIVVIAATNRADMLDPALLRSGRFDRRIFIDNPDYSTRIALFDFYTRKIKMDDSVKKEEISNLMSGNNSSDIKRLVNEAMKYARKKGIYPITIECFNEAYDKIYMGHPGNTNDVNDVEQKVVLYHEAGHAIANLLLPHGDKVRKITAIPRGKALGMVSTIGDDRSLLMSKSKLLSRLKVILAGRAAEEIIFGEDMITSGASNDIEQATYIARLMYGKLGMCAEIGMVRVINENGEYDASPEMMKLFDEKVKELMKTSYCEVKELLKDNRKALDDIYIALMEKKTLTGDEAIEIIKKDSDNIIIGN